MRPSDATVNPMSVQQVPRIHPPKLKRGCIVCSSRTNLQRCAGCRVVQYCADDHQSQHQTAHDEACQTVKDAREKLEHEEAKLCYDSAHSVGGPFCVPPRVFEDHAGFFWSILETRDYILARLAFTDALLGIDTVDAVEMVVGEYIDMLRLCRVDSLDISSRLPGQLLRLGKDQECYEIIKRFANEEHSPSDTDDPGPPLHHFNGSDAFEDPTVALNLSEAEFMIQMLVPALLLNVRLWLNMRELYLVVEALRGCSKNLPFELVVKIQLYLASPAILNNADLVSDIRHGRDLQCHMATLREHIGELCQTISTASGGDFWYFFYRRDSYMKTTLPCRFVSKFDEPAVTALRRNYKAFMETPDAVRITELMSLEELDESDDGDEESTDDSSEQGSSD